MTLRMLLHVCDFEARKGDLGIGRDEMEPWLVMADTQDCGCGGIEVREALSSIHQLYVRTCGKTDIHI